MTHDRAAALKEDQASRARGPVVTRLLAEAAHHRRAARDDREAAEHDREEAATHPSDPSDPDVSEPD